MSQVAEPQEALPSSQSWKGSGARRKFSDAKRIVNDARRKVNDVTRNVNGATRTKRISSQEQKLPEGSITPVPNDAPSLS